MIRFRPRTDPAADTARFRGDPVGTAHSCHHAVGREPSCRKFFSTLQDERLVLPPIDAALINSVVRIVTGQALHDPRSPEKKAVAPHSGRLHELLWAVRFDRAPMQWRGKLAADGTGEEPRKMAFTRPLARRPSRLWDEAVEWAKSTIIDLEAMEARRPLRGMQSMPGSVLDGPPGHRVRPPSRGFFAAATGPSADPPLRLQNGRG